MNSYTYVKKHSIIHYIQGTKATKAQVKLIIHIFELMHLLYSMGEPIIEANILNFSLIFAFI